MKVLVTGASGFIGSHLVEKLLESGFTVRALVHYKGSGDIGWLRSIKGTDGLEILQGDVADSSCIRKAVVDCSTVFHLAALIGIPYSYVAPESYVRTNVVGTLNVLEAVRDTGARLVHTSTSEVYGSAQTPFINESHPLVGQSPYSATKISADHLVEAYVRSFGVDAKIVRPFNTYGPRQSARAVIPQIIRQGLNAKNRSGAIELGSLLPTRDLTFVTDTANGFIMAANTSNWDDQELVCNLGTGYSISIEMLARKILDLMNLNGIQIIEGQQRIRPVKSEVLDLRSDNSRAFRLMKWQPDFGGEDGLDRGLSITIDWYASEFRDDGRQLGYEI